jgi:hypothetical protein
MKDQGMTDHAADHPDIIDQGMKSHVDMKDQGMTDHAADHPDITDQGMKSHVDMRDQGVDTGLETDLT